VEDTIKMFEAGHIKLIANSKEKLIVV